MAFTISALDEAMEKAPNGHAYVKAPALLRRLLNRERAGVDAVREAEINQWWCDRQRGDI